MLNQILIFSKENSLELILLFNILLNSFVLCLLFYGKKSIYDKIKSIYILSNQVTFEINKLDKKATGLKKEINALNKSNADHKYEIINYLNDLKTETIDEQTSRYKINEAIRKAMARPEETNG